MIEKTVVSTLYRKIIKRFLKVGSKSNIELREEIMFDRRQGDGFEKNNRVMYKAQIHTSY